MNVLFASKSAILTDGCRSVIIMNDTEIKKRLVCLCLWAYNRTFILFTCTKKITFCSPSIPSINFRKTLCFLFYFIDIFLRKKKKKTKTMMKQLGWRLWHWRRRRLHTKKLMNRTGNIEEAKNYLKNNIESIKEQWLKNITLFKPTYFNRQKETDRISSTKYSLLVNYQHN